MSNEYFVTHEMKEDLEKDVFNNKHVQSALGENNEILKKDWDEAREHATMHNIGKKDGKKIVLEDFRNSSGRTILKEIYTTLVQDMYIKCKVESIAQNKDKEIEGKLPEPIVAKFNKMRESAPLNEGKKEITKK